MLGLQPEQPDRRAWVEPEELVVARARRSPTTIVVVDEAYVEYGARSCAPWVDELENLVVLRTMSKAFGFAALRVGYALAHPDDRGAAHRAARAGADLRAGGRDRRRGAARAAARRRRDDDRGARAGAGGARRGRLRLPADGDELRLRCAPTSRSRERLEAQGIVVRAFPDGIRITRAAARPRTTSCSARSAPSPGRRRAARRPSLRTTTETALRLTLVARRQRPHARRDRASAFSTTSDAARRSTPASTSSSLAGGDLDVDEHHTVEDVHAALGAALAQALGAREGVARYGSAVVPMDEARATAAVDLVRRPHAEIALAFAGDRVGALAVSLLRHALERFAIEAGCTVHVESSGADDHHVAEAAYKALGQALRQAVAPGAAGIRSTKGWHERDGGSRSPTTAPGTSARSRPRSSRAGAEPVSPSIPRVVPTRRSR